jgi:hypothetical protein
MGDAVLLAGGTPTRAGGAPGLPQNIEEEAALWGFS